MVSSPEIFRRWAALSTVAGALGRRCSVVVWGEPVFPHMYVLLVARPGVGKSQAVRKASSIARRLKEINFAADKITGEKLLDDLDYQFRRSLKVKDGELQEPETTMTAIVDEFGVFCKKGDIDFMAMLAKLYDANEIFEYRTKHHGEVKLENVCFNMIAGCTPTWIKEGFPSDAFEMGFPARLVMVHADQKPNSKTDPFTSVPDAAKLREALTHDLRLITKLRGEFTYDEDAKDFLRDWLATGMAPFPVDPRLETYNTRRILHTSKVAMAVAASTHGDLSIRLEDIQEARSTLLDAEKTMPRALAAAGENPLKPYMQLVTSTVRAHLTSTNKTLPEYRLRQLLEDEVPPLAVEQILSELVKSRRVHATGEAPNRMFSTKQDKK